MEQCHPISAVQTVGAMHAHIQRPRTEICTIRTFTEIHALRRHDVQLLHFSSGWAVCFRRHARRQGPDLL